MHKEISKIQLYTNGGIVIHFKDGDHTYIEPEEMMEIAEETIKLVNQEEDG